MPSHYTIQSDPLRPSTRQSVAFANGQAVHIEVLRDEADEEGDVGFGFGRAVNPHPARLVG